MKKPERTTDTHIYFWGSFYSQWSKYYMQDEILGRKFSSCEQYMMYHKAILFKDKAIAAMILNTDNAQKQKELGKKVKKFNQKEWDKHKFNIIVKGNLLKFTQNEDIQKELLDSGDKTIVEASPFDKIYGVGLKWNNDLILDESNWDGDNLLGKALMKVREIIKTQDNDKIKELSKCSAFVKEVNSENFSKKLLESANEALAHAKGEKELKTTEVKLYNKLIRDKIPQVIHKNKKTCETYNEEGEKRLLEYYIDKIEEEFEEVKDSKTKAELLEELADLSEVMDGLLENLNLKEEVLKIKKEKKEKRGGFSNLILKSVRSEKHEWFTYKDDKFKSCKKCGCIENINNKDGNCTGKQKIELREEVQETSEEKLKSKIDVIDNKELTFRKEVLYCPKCGKNHVDEGEWSKRLHHKHLCLHCNHIWELKDYVFGIKEEDKKELFKEIKGSILDAKEDIIAQGCNCSGASGAGIAKFIGQVYPESDKKYKDLCKNKKFKLGSVMFNEEKGKVQAFCGTQIYYGKFLKMDKDSIEDRYLAIEECLKKIYKKAKDENLSVALPRIGCGRARADWDRVKSIIKKIFNDYPVTIYWIPDKYSKK